MANAEVVFDFGALGTLARAGWSNHNDIHGRALGALVSAPDLGKEVVEAHLTQVYHRDVVFFL